MTKKKKIINGLIFLVGLIVFAVYYFEDTGDMKKVDQEQEKSTKEAAESPEGLDAIGIDLADFEEDTMISDTAL